MAKLNEEAINEVMTILNEVKDVVRLLWEFGININSDCWSASSMGGEDILHWERKNFEEFDEISKGDEFYIGGNIVTGNQHKYKGESIIAPKELAEVEGEIFKKYLTSVINSVPTKHFDLEIEDEYGLINNCGWEHWIIIKTTVRESATTNDIKTKEIIEQIAKKYGYDYIYTAFDDNHDNMIWVDNLEGYDEKYVCMIEKFSDLIDPSNYEPSPLTGDIVTDEYIDAIVEERDNMRQLKKEIEDEYSKKGVKVGLSKWNVGCQYGMVMYVWIPSQ